MQTKKKFLSFFLVGGVKGLMQRYWLSLFFIFLMVRQTPTLQRETQPDDWFIKISNVAFSSGWPHIRSEWGSSPPSAPPPLFPQRARSSASCPRSRRCELWTHVKLLITNRCQPSTPTFTGRDWSLGGRAELKVTPWRRDERGVCWESNWCFFSLSVEKVWLKM